jgi:hypothetical protein
MGAERKHDKRILDGGIWSGRTHPDAHVTVEVDLALLGPLVAKALRRPRTREDGGIECRTAFGSGAFLVRVRVAPAPNGSA